jgi:L-rhamnose isomerase
MSGLGVMLFTLFLPVSLFAHVKSITPRPDELLQVKTAIGIATIIQVPDTIQSAIIGDQSGFKVEYIDKAVTIKPLRFGARTNLYLITSKQRFNLTLVSAHQDQADYVIYIKDKIVIPKVSWQKFAREVRSDTMTLKITRVGVSSEGFVLLDGSISSSEYRIIRPQDFWIYQGKDSKTINSLFISQRSVTKNKPVILGLSFAKSDIDKNVPVQLTLKDQESLSIQIPDSLWK